MTSLDFAPVAVTFQAIGTLLLAFMLAQLGRNFAWRYARRWALAWGAMFVAIMAVRIFIATLHWPWWIVYLLAQWTFIALLYAGCRELVDRPIALKYLAYAAPMAIALAAILSIIADEFNDLFTIEAAIVSLGAMISFAALGTDTRRTVGWQMMRLSLVLMAILYLVYVPLYAIESRGIRIGFLPYSSLADLLAEIFLGFSMVLISSEAAHRDLTDAVAALQVARDQLQIKANTDPLTAALSRHAFNAMPRGMSGAVVMIDIDRLKQINDEGGHDAGDVAIRVVANAIRTRIRADDLLFRWGGDEFLVIMPSSSLDLVEQRFGSLSDGILMNDGQTLTVSWGSAEFTNAEVLEHAIREADRAMYARRHAARITGVV